MKLGCTEYVTRHGTIERLNKKKRVVTARQRRLQTKVARRRVKEIINAHQ